MKKNKEKFTTQRERAFAVELPFEITGWRKIVGVVTVVTAFVVLPFAKYSKHQAERKEAEEYIKVNLESPNNIRLCTHHKRT